VELFHVGPDLPKLNIWKLLDQKFSEAGCPSKQQQIITRTLTLDSMWLLIEMNIQAYSSVTVYCMNFIIFLCVTLKLFSLSFQGRGKRSVRGVSVQYTPRIMKGYEGVSLTP